MVTFQASFIFFQVLIKVVLKENIFREVWLLVSVGAVLAHGNRRHRKKKITLFHGLCVPTDDSEWGCLMRGTRNTVYFPVFFARLSIALYAPCHRPTHTNPKMLTGNLKVCDLDAGMKTRRGKCKSPQIQRGCTFSEDTQTINSCRTW